MAPFHFGNVLQGRLNTTPMKEKRGFHAQSRIRLSAFMLHIAVFF